jgi:hypothetical protein
MHQTSTLKRQNKRQKLKKSYRNRVSQVQGLTLVIPAIREAESRRTEVQGQPGQKAWETPSQPIKSLVRWCMPVILAIWA